MRILRRIAKRTLARILPDHARVKISGHCPCCDSASSFVSTDLWFRDNLKCMRCACIPRERALMQEIERVRPDWRGLKIHESSPVDRGASARLRTGASGYVASYFFPDRKSGEIVDGFANCDLQSQPFADESFDLVVTQDLFEHLPHPELAFAEIERTLKPGGAHIFTVPLVNKNSPSERWAELVDGKVVFSGTPEFHGDPINDRGTPVMMHWGYDIRQAIQSATRMTARIRDCYDPRIGVVGEHNEVVVAVKD